MELTLFNCNIFLLKTYHSNQVKRIALKFEFRTSSILSKNSRCSDNFITYKDKNHFHTYLSVISIHVQENEDLTDLKKKKEATLIGYTVRYFYTKPNPFTRISFDKSKLIIA